MASNIATGIGLSGQLKVDNSGQLNRLAAEQAAAQQRQKEAAAKKKADEDLLKDVRKNVLIDSKLKTSFYQRDFAQRATNTIADIVKGVQDDEMTTAEVMQQMQNFNNYVNSVRSADDALYQSIETVRQDPGKYDWQGTRQFGGKEVNSIFEALQDPYSNTPEGMSELMGKFAGSEYFFKESTPEEVAMGMPERIVGYNPIEMMDPLEASQQFAKSKNLYSELKMGETEFFDPRTRTLMRESGYAMPEGAVNLVKEGVMTNQNVLRYYEAQLKKEYKANNPGATDADFMRTDWISDAQKRYDNEVVPVLEQSLENKRIVTSQIDKAPQIKEKPSLFKKKYNVSPMSVVDYGDHTANRVTFNPISSPGKSTMRIPDDAVLFLPDGSKTEAPKKGVNTEINPVGVEWKNGELYFLANIKDGEDDVTVSIPKSQEAFEAMAAGLYLSKEEERTQLVNYIKDVVGTDPKALEEGFFKSLGVTDEQLRTLEGFVGGRQGVGAETSNEKTTPENFNKKWAELKSGESLVGPDGKTYTKK